MLLRILLPLLLLLALPAWGIDMCVLRKRFGAWVRRCFYLPNVVVAVWLVALALNESYSPAADHAKGLALTVALCIIVPETLWVLFALAGSLLRRFGRVRAALHITGGVLALALLGALLFGFLRGYKKIHSTQVTFSSPSVPATFDGYRIVQLSDLHLGTIHGQPGLARRIVDSVNAQRPDLIAFTGDLVNYNADELTEFEAILSRLRATDGVVSVMGNHDYMFYYAWPSDRARQANVRQLQARQRAMGWRLLLNENLIVRRGADSIAVVGVENDGRPPFPSRGDLVKAQAGLGPSCFKVLLSHDPTHWRRRVLPETDIPLMLAGHTHGMQFKIGSFSPASWFYPEWGGVYREGGRVLHVSLGTGEVLLPFRLGAWPEINVITLRSA